MGVGTWWDFKEEGRLVRGGAGSAAEGGIHEFLKAAHSPLWSGIEDHCLRQQGPSACPSKDGQDLDQGKDSLKS
jgi:hypothetical protein